MGSIVLVIWDEMRSSCSGRQFSQYLHQHGLIFLFFGPHRCSSNHSCRDHVGGHISIFSPIGPLSANLQASKVLASQYWRPKIRGRPIKLKLKIYLPNRPCRFQKQLQNHCNFTNTEVLLVSHKNFFVPEKFFQTSLNKLLCLERYSDSKAIFEIYRVDLVNKFLIST